MLLQALYTIRSERLLMEEIDYSILFRWFVGLSMDEPIWSPTTFSKNRDRLLQGDVASAFFDAVVDQAREAGLLSDEHFTVDGTLLEAWASLKSFQRKDDGPTRAAGRSGQSDGQFPRRDSRSNDTHESTTDPDAQSGSQGQGQGSQAVVSRSRAARQSPRAGGQCVCDAATGTGGTGGRRCCCSAQAPDATTVGGDKGFDVAQLRAPTCAPSGSRRTSRRRTTGIAIDGRTTRHPGYAISQRKRKLIEQVFGWMKTIGGLRKLRHRGGELVDWIVTFTAAAYNLVRLRTLLARPA